MQYAPREVCWTCGRKQLVLQESGYTQSEGKNEQKNATEMGGL